MSYLPLDNCQLLYGAFVTHSSSSLCFEIQVLLPPHPHPSILQTTISSAVRNSHHTVQSQAAESYAADLCGSWLPSVS